MSETADMAAPDVAGPVIAYRAWQADGDCLTSMAVREHVWKPGRDHQATCPLSAPLFPNPHDAPSPGCRCGFYVMHTLDDLLNEPTQVAHVRAYLNPVVAGEVEVWGHSERYERGRRVQWCRIRSLYDTPLAGDVDVGALAERYGVPVVADDGTISEWRKRNRIWEEGFTWTFTVPAHSSSATPSPAQYFRSYHAHPVALPPATQMRQIADAYRDAMHKTMTRFRAQITKAAEALQSLQDALDAEPPRDPDKPIPSPPRDHLRLAQQRSPRSIHPRGGWKP